MRYYGLLTGAAGRAYEIPGGPGRSIHEEPATRKPHVCARCKGTEWIYVASFSSACEASLIDHLFDLAAIDTKCCPPRTHRFSLGSPRDGPPDGN